jgi:hypothetical protein
MAISLLDPRHIALGTLVIPSGASASPFLTSDAWGMCDIITVHAPAALTGTVTLQVLKDETLDETAAGSWTTLQQPAGTDVALAVNKAVNVVAPAGAALRLLSGGTEAAARTFHVVGRKRRVAS